MNEDANNKSRHYIFLDEGGNLDFTGTGTKYFTLTAITKQRPFVIEPSLLPLKYDLIESGLNIEYFHASEDRQAVRNQVFQNITNNLSRLSINSVVVEKSKMNPHFQQVEHLYPMILACLLGSIMAQFKTENHDEFIVITDRLPLNAKRKAIEKGIKTNLKQTLRPHTKYRILHHSSRSAIGLQIADYCNWAIYRKWEIGDLRSYNVIAPAIHQEYNITDSAQERIFVAKTKLKPKK